MKLTEEQRGVLEKLAAGSVIKHYHGNILAAVFRIATIGAVERRCLHYKRFHFLEFYGLIELDFKAVDPLLYDVYKISAAGRAALEADDE